MNIELDTIVERKKKYKIANNFLFFQHIQDNVKDELYEEIKESYKEFLINISKNPSIVNLLYFRNFIELPSDINELKDIVFRD